jgi:hypothetical protein
MNANPITEPGSPAATDTAALALAAAEGRAPDPAVVRRVRERAEQARRELLAARGAQDMGVQLIREIRGALPES